MEYFVVPYEFKDFFSVFVKKKNFEFLIGIAVNMYITLDSMDSLTILILSIMNMGTYI